MYAYEGVSGVICRESVPRIMEAGMEFTLVYENHALNLLMGYLFHLEFTVNITSRFYPQ